MFIKFINISNICLCYLFYRDKVRHNDRVASELGISGNLEKSGNFVALEKCQGKVREFREILKSQGILLERNEYRRSFT